MRKLVLLLFLFLCFSVIVEAQSRPTLHRDIVGETNLHKGQHTQMNVMRVTVAMLLLCGLALSQAVLIHNGNNSIIRAGLRVQYRFNEGSGQYALNRVLNSAPPTTTNLFSTGEQWGTQPLFGINSWTAAGSLTLTDFAAADPNGNTTATRAQFGAGIGATLLYQQNTLAAATYTISLYVKSNTGLTQAMRFIAGGAFSADKSITTSWTRVTHTFTLGAPSASVVGFATDAAGDAMDILIYGGVLNTGGSASDYVIPTLDQQLGKLPIADAADPSWTSTGLDFSSGGKYAYGISNAAIPITSSFSFYAVVNKTGSTLASGMEPITAENYATLKFILASSLSGFNNVGAKVPSFMLGGQTAYAYGVVLNDGNYHVLTGTYDGVKLKIFLDSVLVGYLTAAISAPTIRQLYVSELAGQSPSTMYFPGIVSGGLLYETYHDQAKINQDFTAIANDMALRGVTIAKPTKFVVFEGDSLTDPLGAPGVAPPAPPGIFTNGWAYNYLNNLGQIVQGTNLALSGSTVVSAGNASRTLLVDQTYDPNRLKDLFITFFGANDGNSGITPALFVSQYKSYLVARKAAAPNRKIAVLGVLPQTTAHVGFNAWRNTVNALIAADPDFTNGTASDAFVRIDQQPNIGPDAAAMDPTLYYDGEHLTALGLSYLWPVVVAGTAPFMP